MQPPEEPQSLERNQERYQKIWQQLQEIDDRDKFQNQISAALDYYDPNAPKRFYTIKQFASFDDLLEGHLHPFLIDLHKLKYPIYELDPEIEQPRPVPGYIRRSMSSLGMTPEFFRDSEGHNISYIAKIIVGHNQDGRVAIFRLEHFDPTVTPGPNEDFPKGPDGAPSDTQSYELVEPDTVNLANLEQALSAVLNNKLIIDKRPSDDEDINKA